jgi:regulator of replication initiation timing
VRQFEHAWEIRAADGGLICFVQSETLARAIAAIPEMLAQIGSLKAEIDWHCEEINRLRAEMDYNVSIRERLKLLEDSNRDLRAEKAAIEAATIERCAKLADAHDPFEGGTEMPVGDAIRALAKANETEA